MTRELPPDRLLQPATARWFAALFGSALVYAIIRYHLAGDVPWRYFPLFILNKATSLAAVFFVAAVIPLLVKRRAVEDKKRRQEAAEGTQQSAAHDQDE